MFGGIILGPLGIILNLDHKDLIIPGWCDIGLLLLSTSIEITMLYFMARSFKFEKAGKIAFYLFIFLVYLESLIIAKFYLHI